MSLVSYLKALCSRFYSKNESELVANQAMPGESTIEYYSGSVEGWGEITNFVAPACGYVRVYGKSMSNNGGSSLGIVTQHLQTSISYPVAGLSLEAFLPVKQGKQVSLFGAAVENIGVIFVRTVGGGDKPLHQLHQGGLLCLRNSLKRCLSSLVVCQCHRLKAILNLFLLRKKDHTITVSTLLRHPMGFCMFKHLKAYLTAKFNAGLDAVLRVLLRMVLSLQIGAAGMLQLKREKTASFIWRQQQKFQNVFLYQPLAPSNLGLGGARC